MIKSFAFQTKARTVDHLGREQIADCPTAISELWKNAYDAYARSASLQIFDGDTPVAALYDDGHGMNRDEFINSWLVVGTASKMSKTSTPHEDRNGLQSRIKQGQKGIGRLSSANIGPLLLLVSKRRDQDYITSLIDWRIFENPFLNLTDILIPVVEFKKQSELLKQLPDLFDALMTNLSGDQKDAARTKRIIDAWKEYDELIEREGEEKDDAKRPPASQEIASTIIAATFETQHLEQWSVWSGETDHGTALLISQITYDLKVYLNNKPDDAAAVSTKDRIFETLSCFINPYVPKEEIGSAPWNPEFGYEVKVWKGRKSKLVVGSTKEFSRHLTDPMEHRIEGIITPKGEFVGKIKAFGKWQGGEYRIPPPKDLTIPDGPTTKVGPVRVYIASLEFLKANTTHDSIEFANFKELAERYSGLMVFRDGLRVMPYGRTDNDFFEIEERRSKHAGREFWNKRQMFGGISIRDSQNPNLKDKAGREGIVDNVASKTLKGLIANVLMRSARECFGTASEIRKDILPNIQAANKKQRVAEQRNKQARVNRQKFDRRLKKYLKELPEILDGAERYVLEQDINDLATLYKVEDRLSEFEELAVMYRLPGAPKKLRSLESSYASYQQMASSLNQTIVDLDEKVEEAKTRIKPEKPAEVTEKQLQRNAGQIHGRTKRWKKDIDSLQKSEAQRMRELISERNKLFHHEMTPLIERVENENISMAEASKLMNDFRDRINDENENLFPPYIRALESLQESIDIEYLANFAVDEVSELETEIERLNSLAQLGIAVEIIGHELEAYDDIIGSGIGRLPENITDSAAVKDIKLGYDGLTDQLRYLSPLKLSGQKVQRWITGEEIFDYVFKFFEINLTRAGIKFEPSDEFKTVRVYDQPSRLFPVFINLVNNSRYWLGLSDVKDRMIRFDIVGSDVVVSDNGPGVDPENIENLFSLFFTTKLRGGRGIGLYLCKSNLAAGGHKIRYTAEGEKTPLSGANFYIDFRGVEFSND